MTDSNQMLAKFESMGMNDTISSSMANAFYVGDFYEPFYKNYYYPTSTHR